MPECTTVIRSPGTPPAIRTSATAREMVMTLSARARPPRRRGRRASRLPGHGRQQGAELGEAERLVQVWPVEALEEGEGVPSYRVTRAEDQPCRKRRMAAGQLLVELPAAELRHAEVGDH